MRSFQMSEFWARKSLYYCLQYADRQKIVDNDVRVRLSGTIGFSALVEITPNYRQQFHHTLRRQYGPAR